MEGTKHFSLLFADDFEGEFKDRGIEDGEGVLLDLNGYSYLHVQPCDTGWDYSFYDAEMNLIDGGLLEDPEMSQFEAVRQLCESLFSRGVVVKRVPMSLLGDE